MSNIAIKGAATGTGVFTLESPATNTDRTLVLPDASGTIVTTATLPSIPNPLTLGTEVATTSGTAIDFTGIPSWVKRITLLFSGVSTNGAANYFVRIGSGSIQATGYTSTATYMTTGPSTASDTTSFIIRADNAANNICGAMVMYNISGNTWVEEWTGGATGTNQSYLGGGAVTLTGALDQLRLTTSNGTDTFDAGSINIMYE
tara:strand:+ start:58 stop:666 length:609 start_codon:yes stop_codon:yes gene_type:complete